MFSQTYKYNCRVLKIFVCILLLPRIWCEDRKEPTDFILCRRCGADIASADAVVNLKSPAASTYTNLTLFGLKNVLLQKLVNPLNVEFSVVTSKLAQCTSAGRWSEEHSWYPGYTWKVCVCSRCGHHLGWLFEPLSTAGPDRLYASSKGFYALIFENIISEFYSNSLLISPKTVTYR